MQQARGFLGAALMPHGTMTLDPKKEGAPKGVQELHDAMREAGRIIRGQKPDLIILTTPHGVVLSGAVGFYISPSANGSAEWNSEWKEFSVDVKVNEGLSLTLLDFLRKKDVPAEGLLFFAPGTPAILRWAEVVPLHFLLGDDPDFTPEFVIMPTPRGLGVTVEDRANHRASCIYSQLAKTGALIREWADSLDRRVWLIASGDLSHLHTYDMSVSPIFKPAPNWVDWASSDEAGPFDKEMEHWVETLAEDDMRKLADKANAAVTCGITGSLVLHGALAGKAGWKSHMLANVHPTYFGMMVAVWTKEA